MKWIELELTTFFIHKFPRISRYLPLPNPHPNRTWSKRTPFFFLWFFGQEEQRGWSLFFVLLCTAKWGSKDETTLVSPPTPLIFYCSSHNMLSQIVYNMFYPSHFVYPQCHGRPLLIKWGNWHASPPFWFHALIDPYRLTYHILKVSYISPISWIHMQSTKSKLKTFTHS